MVFKWCVVLLLICGCQVGCGKKKIKSVSTVIDAKWDRTPIALEIAEYLWDEDPLLFWKYVDVLSAHEPPISEITNERTVFDLVVDSTKNLLSDAQRSLLKFSLSLHIYAPRVELFGQMGHERGIDCPTAADVAGSIVCDCPSKLENTIKAAINEAKTKQAESTTETFHLDHQYPGSNGSVVVVLYSSLGTSGFAKFHRILKQHADNGEIVYIVRHWVMNRPPKKLRLSGYGVELQMKSTEYKVQDDTKVEGGAGDDASEEEEEVEGFNFSKLKQIYPDKKAELEKFRQELLESTSELAPLKVWQFQELSLQAAQRIMSAPKEEALHVLTHIAQNFPTQARSLVKTVVSNDLKTEMKQNQDRFAVTLHIQPSDTALFINGMFFDLETQDIFTIFDYIRQELKVIDGLKDIGFTEKKLFKSLVNLDISHPNSEYALDIRDSAVVWLNDIENDSQYKRWPSSLNELLRPTFPGMLRSIRRNIYNLVVVGNPADIKVRPLVKLMQSFLIHNAFLRLGLVFSVNDQKSGLEDSGVALLNAFNYLLELKDASQAINFITDVYAATPEDSEIDPKLVASLLKSKFSAPVDEVFGDDSDYNTGLKLSKEFIERSGLRSMPQALLNGIPLSEKSLNAEDFEDGVLGEVMAQTTTIQKAIYKKELRDSDDIVDFLMTQKNVMPRLNERVLTTTNSKFIDLSKVSKSFINTVYYARNKPHNPKDIDLMTNWIIADLNEESGRVLYSNAISQMENSGRVRVGLVINAIKSTSEPDFNKIAVAVLKKFSDDEAVKKIKQILHDYKLILQKKKTGEDYGLKNEDSNGYEQVLKKHQEFCKNTLNIEPGQRALLSNGRLLGPFESDETFIVEDFSLLEVFNLNTFTKIYKAITSNSDDPESLTSDMLMKAVSLLAARPETKSRFDVVPSGDEHSVVKLPPTHPELPAFDLIAIVDPVSHGAHKLGTVLTVLQQVVNSDIRIFLNCVEKNSDMPLKSFYRYVLEPTIHFSEDGTHMIGPMAKFVNMPGTPLLTQNMLVPDNWFVESIASPHDLDNIRLDQVDSTVHSQFELEYLILDGHCFDPNTGSPPRGLQVTLGAASMPNAFDTIVMANLGYFQLKANPGAWELQLRHGRSSELYDITGFSHEGVDHQVNKSIVKVLVSSFRAHTIKLRVTKKPDKMGVDLLSDESEEQQGLWGSLTNTFGGTKDDSNDKSEETINIFSLASGHLYERFLRIMMLSVLKHTKSPVKFWFLKNYLSPTFKDFLPRMAKHYKFQYELVQYKWPRWLHQQTEKQRIIWGYKILFLDVLFPLDVKKIIFVDADQVVRADMKELVDLDLGGAPYGYTPFCDSRTEMDGFRFWKSGYWRNHLQGRKYHISALYVVDLKRFRRIAAGDRLRGQYQALSQDPNSLSNLDQDLPNNMIHQVGIKSLPQEWLWCETWCDDASKKTAKTIDLCNNPLTKEAKLTAAMRILSEWKDYDNEIKSLQLQLGATEDHEEEESTTSKPDRSAHSKSHTEL